MYVPIYFGVKFYMINYNHWNEENNMNKPRSKKKCFLQSLGKIYLFFI